MNVLITGGAGYLGSVLIERLFNNGSITKLTVYDNLMYNQTSLIHYSWRKNFEFVYGDVRDQEKLSKYVDEADVIIPLAAIVGFPACDRDKDLATAVNYTHVKFICDRIKDTNKKIISNFLDITNDDDRRPFTDFLFNNVNFEYSFSNQSET